MKKTSLSTMLLDPETTLLPMTVMLRRRPRLWSSLLTPLQPATFCTGLILIILKKKNQNVHLYIVKSIALKIGLSPPLGMQVKIFSLQNKTWISLKVLIVWDLKFPTVVCVAAIVQIVEKGIC